MVKCCCKCGRSNKKDKSIILFSIPSKGTNTNPKWQSDFAGRLGFQDIEDKNLHICSRHFKSDDIIMKNSSWKLKENALPIKTETDVEEYLEVRPEVIFLNCDGELSQLESEMSETGETKELAPLEPLIEYVDVYEPQDGEVHFENEVVADDMDAGNVDELAATEYNIEENGSQVISVVSRDENNLEIEPMMPFLLTSSPIFTILNENNEVGETIILQIENAEEKKERKPDPDSIHELQKLLCKNKGDVTNTYSCDICDSSYGCLNCLKSHYGTLHIFNSVTHYKCKFSYYISKSLICPVCDLTSQTRNETMDHYITHSVACEICGSGFDRQLLLTEHYRTVHNKSDYEATYECELCKVVYQYPVTITKHYQNFHKMILCPICKVRFASVSELQDHERVHRQQLNVLPFACSKCDKAFPKISDIAVHIRQDHHKKWSNPELEHIPTQYPTEGEKNHIYMPVQKKVKLKK